LSKPTITINTTPSAFGVCVGCGVAFNRDHAVFRRRHLRPRQVLTLWFGSAQRQPHPEAVVVASPQHAALSEGSQQVDCSALEQHALCPSEVG
jgi:hypothetical protein